DADRSPRARERCAAKALGNSKSRANARFEKDQSGSGWNGNSQGNSEVLRRAWLSNGGSQGPARWILSRDRSRPRARHPRASAFAKSYAESSTSPDCRAGTVLSRARRSTSGRRRDRDENRLQNPVAISETVGDLGGSSSPLLDVKTTRRSRICLASPAGRPIHQMNEAHGRASNFPAAKRSEERREGKSVELGGGSMRKRKKKKMRERM